MFIYYIIEAVIIGVLIARTLGDNKGIVVPRNRPPGYLPARALSVDAAISILKAAQKDGLISASGYDGARVNLGSTVAGVSYEYGNLGPAAMAYTDVRLAVLLLRLAIYLRDNFHVTSIGHFGILREGESGNAHTDGRAMDLAWFKGSGINLAILRDWGQKPAPYDINTATETTYRLTPKDSGYQFFLALYDFCASEGADKSTAYEANGAASSIGYHSYVIHPDTPTPYLRLQHQNHVHVQVGPTRPG